MKAHVYVMLKAGVLDSQGQASKKALAHLGFDNVSSVRQGKFIELELSETNKDKAHAQLDKMCKALLANEVIETYRVELIEA
jgi:phosphoribosylformylglycinamidine synthase subunit PurS